MNITPISLTLEKISDVFAVYDAKDNLKISIGRGKDYEGKTRILVLLGPPSLDNVRHMYERDETGRWYHFDDSYRRTISAGIMQDTLEQIYDRWILDLIASAPIEAEDDEKSST